MKRFKCDDVGEVKEYIGCKLEKNEEERSFKFIQLVLLQSLSNEFDTSEKKHRTPAEAGTVLIQGSEGAKVGSKKHMYYRKGVGKLLHATRWSRPEIQNSVRELARQGSTPSEAHVKALHRIMEYCKATPERGWELKPSRK